MPRKVGHSGGLISAWNSALFYFRPFSTGSGILLFGRCRELNISLHLFICYGAVSDKMGYWFELRRSGLLDLGSLIVAGDLNFTVAARESWGLRARDASSNDWFKNMVDSHHLIDVAPSPFLPTWRNGRKGLDAVAKRIDRFLIHENLYSGLDYCCSWVENVHISNHMPIMLKMGVNGDRTSYPFKYCPIWSNDRSFIHLVKQHWDNFSVSFQGSSLHRLPSFFRSLKAVVSPWILRKKLAINFELSRIDSELNVLYSSPLGITESDEIKTLEAEKSIILSHEEELWRLKSRTLWLSCGDSNTKFFHSYAA